MTTLGDPAASCDAMRVLLSGLIDRELDPASERTVVDHLATCAGCRDEKDLIETFSRELREGGRRAPAPPAWESVMRLVLSSSARPAPADSAAAPANPAAAGAAADGAWLPAGDTKTAGTPGSGLAAERGRRGWGRTLIAAAAAVAFLALAGVAGSAIFRSVLRNAPVQPVEVTAASLSPEIFNQLLDPRRAPDFRRVGTARAVNKGQLRSVRDEVSFSPIAPEALPGGYLFEGGWVITSRSCRMVCLRYKGDGKCLVILQSASGGAEICTLSNPRCCLLGGLACKRSRVDRVDVLQTRHGDLALTVAVPAGQADLDTVMASLAQEATVRTD